MPNDWHTPNRHPDRQQIDRARDAAEALFRPKPETARTEPPSAPLARPTGGERQPTHKPPILSAQTAAPTEPEHRDPPADMIPERPTAARRRKVPKSDHSRIQTLITYGMSVEEVAELYDARVSDIERIAKLG